VAGKSTAQEKANPELTRRWQDEQILRARVIKKTAQAAPYLAGMEAGWTQSLERLAACVATESKE
jgi:hypothetical protein